MSLELALGEIGAALLGLLAGAAVVVMVFSVLEYVSMIL